MEIQTVPNPTVNEVFFSNCLKWLHIND